MSTEDRYLLEKLLPKGLNFTVFLMEPDAYKVENISPPERYISVLRCIEISDDLVRQTLIEWASINSCAIADSTEEAQRQLKKGIRNPETMIVPHHTARHLMVMVSYGGHQLSSTKMKPGVLSVEKRGGGLEEVAEAKKRVVSMNRELRALQEEVKALGKLKDKQTRLLRVQDKLAQTLGPKLRQLRLGLDKAITDRDALPGDLSSDKTDLAIDLKLLEIDNIKEQLGEAFVALKSSWMTLLGSPLKIT